VVAVGAGDVCARREMPLTDAVAPAAPAAAFFKKRRRLRDVSVDFAIPVLRSSSIARAPW